MADPDNDPRLLVMISLADVPKHGHAMLLDIEAFSGRRLGPGTLYGAITRLEEEGFIEAMPPDGRRRPYRMTQSGWLELRTRVDRIGGAVNVARRRLAGR